MVTVQKIITVVLIFMVSHIFAQDFQGVATYKTQRKFDIKMDSTKVNDAMQKQMMEMMKKQFQKTYTLTFNQAESIYKQEVSLAAPQMGGGDFQVSFSTIPHP